MIAAPATPNRAARAWRDLSTDTALIYGVLALVALISWGLILANGGQINLANTLVRSVALGMVAVGQTLVILGGSLDLSVAYQVSVTAVMASYVMQGDPDRMLLGIAVVIAIGIAIGLANGLIITGLGVNPFIATLGMALVLRGVLNSSFDNFAGAVPAEFQGLGLRQYRSRALLDPPLPRRRPRCLVPAASHPVRASPLRRRRQ